MSSRQSAPNQQEIEIQVYLTEFERLREEMIQSYTNQHQSVVLVMGSASVALPLLLGQTTNVTIVLIAALLYILTIAYAAIGLNYASEAYAIGEKSRYIHDYIEPEVNRILKTTAEHKVLTWESFVRRERANVFSMFLAYVGQMGSLLLLLLPGGASLLTAEYLSSGMQATPSGTISQIVVFLLPWLSRLAWVSYALAIISIILSILWFKLRWFEDGVKARKRR